MNEPSQGHPLAKNRGIRESRGEIVAFVDDDVFFSSGWLKALASAFERHPEIACIGGKVVPHFEAERPPWIEDEMLWIYGVTRYGDLEREIRFPEIPIGCNMAFRRTVFEKIGDFHMSLGRKPGILLSGDEDHFLLRAERGTEDAVFTGCPGVPSHSACTADTGLGFEQILLGRSLRGRHEATRRRSASRDGN